MSYSNHSKNSPLDPPKINEWIGQDLYKNASCNIVMYKGFSEHQ